MSITSDNISENSLKNNEDACVLREIFNLIEAKMENKEEQNKNKNNPLYDKYKIKNIKIEKLSCIEENPKNRYKSKLQKLLFKKKM
jgi:hypothetical protein